MQADGDEGDVVLGLLGQQTHPDVVAAVQAGEIEFAVDQQQYQQGYLPILMLKLYVENANTLGGGQPVLTGPGIVDADNVDEIADLASAGTR